MTAHGPGGLRAHATSKTHLNSASARGPADEHRLSVTSGGGHVENRDGVSPSSGTLSIRRLPMIASMSVTVRG